MDTEELKLIVQAISELGESGKTAFIVWVALDAAKTAMWALVVGCALWALFKRLGVAIANAVKAHAPR